MNQIHLTLLLVLAFYGYSSGQKPGIGEFPPFTEWYENPLGVSPISLHTANGIILPAIAATAVLLLTPKDSALARRMSYYADLGVSFGYYGSKTTIYQNNLGFFYDLRKFMSLGVEFTSFLAQDEVNNTAGFGIRPFVRFYPIRKENFTLFFQSGAGLIYFLDEFPQPSGFFGDNRMGTRLNGCPKYGIGTTFNLSSQISGQIALWHVHISNGDHPSYERNPGHDSNGFSLGLIYRPLNN